MLSTNMSGGMKAISLDGTRVLERNDPEIREIILSKLKSAEKVDIVSTGSLYSLIVRVKFMPDKPSGFLGFFSSPKPTRLRDEIIDEHGRLMQNDERWLPTTGKPIREIILKCVVVHPEPRKYTYGFLDDKNMMTIQHVQSEYMVQNTAFDKTKSMFPICPDAISLLNFTDMASFDETFSNPIYRDCAVFQKLREYYSSIPGATVAMIVIPAARSGLITAVILGVARVAGETAPLLLTMGGADAINLNPFSGNSSALPFYIWKNFSLGTETAVARAWTGILVLMILVLFFFSITRIVGNRKVRS